MIEFYREDQVAESDNIKLMTLLQLCFPMLPSFKVGRFYLERSNYRWLVRDREEIIANAVVHDKIFLANAESLRVAGIACVCVHPAHRGKGLAKALLSEIQEWASGNGYDFGFLFGKNVIYRSSGYIHCDNDFTFINHRTGEKETKAIDTAHYLPLQNESWPESLIDMQGPMF